MRILLICLALGLPLAAAGLGFSREPRSDGTLSLTAHHRVASSSKPLADVALIWHARRNRSSVPASGFGPIPQSPIRLTIDHGAIRPGVSFLRAGQTLEIAAADADQHAVRVAFFQNLPRGFRPRLDPPLVYRRTIEHAEPAPLEFQCGLHPDERAWVIVQDHPLVGITDRSGQLTIHGVPSGKQWFRLWHPDPAVQTARLTINGQTVILDQGRLQLEVSAERSDFEIQFSRVPSPHEH